MEKRYVNTPEGQLHFRLAGRSTLPPLVLLHQTPSSGVMFEQMLPLLADDFWVLAPDLPGFGSSFSPHQRPFSVPLWSQAIAAALHTLGIQTCALFGHHTGAAVAVQMAHDNQQLVTAVALSGPPLLDEATKARLRAGLPNPTRDEAGDFLLAAWRRMRQRNPAGTLDLSLREMMLGLALNGRYHEAYEAVFAQDFAAQLAQIRCPLLLLAGEHDTLRAALEPAHALAPHATTHLLPHAGSYLCDEQPGEVTAVLRRFLLTNRTS